MTAGGAKRQIPIGKRLEYRLQAVLAWPIGLAFKLLPIDLASGLAGWLGRRLGPRLGLSRRAVANLQIAFPDITAETIDRVIAGMWENLGRVCAELVHMQTLVDDAGRIEIRGAAVLDRLRADGKPALLFAAHTGNWEIVTLAARRHDPATVVVYREFNNPVIDAWVGDLRRSVGIELIPKGAAGARLLLRRLGDGGQVAMLADQRMNDGIPVPFFGRPAMTAPALAELGYRYGAPVVPVRVERTQGARFRVTIEQPLELPRSGDRTADVLQTMTLVNQRIEAWVRARPEQWLWLHRRWGKDAATTKR